MAVQHGLLAMSKMDVDGLLPVGLAANPKVCRHIPMSEVDNATLLTAVGLWSGLKGSRKYPPRSAITPRLLKPILRNTTLLKVIDGGEDYDYRIVGDAYVMAHGLSFQGLRWSQTGRIAPGFQRFIKPIYDRVVECGDALAMRGWVERGGSPTNHVFCEYVYLPLGEAAVDHILVVAAYLRREVAAMGSSSFTI